MLNNLTPIKTVAATVDAADLARALKFAGYVIEKSAIPVLATVKVTAEPDAIAVTATDCDMTLTQVLPADCNDTGATCLAPKPMLAQLSKPKGKASIAFDGAESVFTTGGVTITAGDNLPVTDFPDFYRCADMAHKITVAGDVFLRALDALCHTISTEDYRYYLNGIFMHGGDKNFTYANDHKKALPSPSGLRMVATDGHKLGRYDLPIGDQKWAGAPVILPYKAAHVLRKILKDKASKGALMSIFASETRIMFASARWVFVTKKIDGMFPDYERVLPKSDIAGTVIVDASTIPTACMKFDSDTKAAHWRIDGQELTRPVDIVGDITAGFNGKYLRDFGAACEGPYTLNLISSGDPAVISYPNDPAFLGVIMPMRYN